MVMELISQYQVSSNNRIVYLKAEEANHSSLSFEISSKYKMWILDYDKEYFKATYGFTLALNISPELCYVATFF
jgi:hypothetical protein